ncbi:MAG: ABC transporter permease [Candidatus Ancillula sp.]|nr:ABC transporter permease [Candidatus Ancillula sp.]
MYLSASQNWNNLTPLLFDAIGETLYMVGMTILIGGVVGVLIGLALYSTRKGSLFENNIAYQVLNFIINFIRPIPFIIFLTAVRPLTITVVGTSIGSTAAVFSMTIFCSVATSRLVEQNLVGTDPGVIEAARAMGASRLRILFTVLIPEALAPLILGYAFMFVAVTDMSAMAGTIAGGGLGSFALQYGYKQMDDQVTWVAIAIIIVFVQVVQQLANLVAKKILRRTK